MYNRLLTDRIPAKSFFLFGPRQVGKTTLLDKLSAILRVDLLLSKELVRYTRHPEWMMEQIEAMPEKKGTVILDEIQRVPDLLDVVQSVMKKWPDIRFIMSGSSARKLKRQQANLLGGRAIYRTLHPLTASELGNNFDMNRVLAFGSLPHIYQLAAENQYNEAFDFLRSYLITYLSEEIKAEALVRNLQSFQRFLEVAAAQSAEQVNFTEFGKEADVAYSTIKEYYSILEDTMIGFILPAFSRSQRKRISKTPKFYFFDNGVTRAIQGVLNVELSPLEKGRLFEQWVIQESIRVNAYAQRDLRFSFWRTAQGAEVDLVIERGRQILCAVEIKYKNVISSADISGLRAFQNDFPKVPRFVVSSQEVSSTVNDVEVLPVMEYLRKIEKL